MKGLVFANHRNILGSRCAAAVALVLAFFQYFEPVFADNTKELDPGGASESAGGESRKFNDVLTDLFNEFAYDLKVGEIKGIPNTSIRRVALSEGIPKSYETYLESLTQERVRKFSTTKMIHCSLCKVRRTALENGRVVISNPVNSPKELDKISDILKIETWMDVALIYQEDSMLLAFNLFDAKSKELLWSKIYNSEQMYRKTAESRPRLEGAAPPDGTEAAGVGGGPAPKTSEYMGHLGVGWVLVPNVKKASNMAGVVFRGAEKFNLGRSEIGGTVLAVADPGLFVKQYPGVEGDPSASDEVSQGGKTGVVKPFTIGGGIFATYIHNFITQPEDYDSFRFGTSVSFGSILAKGYITLTGQLGPIVRLGRRFSLETNVMYSAPTTLKLGDDLSYKTKGGVGGSVIFGFNF